MSLASSSAWRRETRGAFGGVGRDRGQSRRREAAFERARYGDGEGEGRRRGGRMWRDGRARVRSERAASRRGGAVGFSRNDRARPSEPRRASPSRWRARAARAPRDGARAPRARRERRARRSLSRNPRDASRELASAFGRDVAAISPAGDAREARRRRPRRRAARFDFLAAARAGKRGRARRAPGWPRLPRRPMRTCWNWRECAVDATRSFGRWARRCVEARHASNGVFNTSYEIRLLFRPLSAEDLPVRDLETFTPANDESRI